MNPTLRDATAADLPGVLAIYNDAVVNTTAIWNDVQVDLANRQAWFDERRARGFPVLVVVDAANQVLGYASFGDFRPFQGYAHTAEHSVYVRGDSHGQGLGSRLLAALVQRAREMGKHVLVAAVESGNQASIRLHERQGFAVTGQMPQVGCKFGRWLDLTLMQLTLGDTLPPASPTA